ncbi:unnamed protein product [Merluccius merluccius]
MMCDAASSATSTSTPSSTGTSTSRSFRANLASILEQLTKAALFEISKLADDCSAVLHAEAAQHKGENDALRKRCFSLELQLRAAREEPPHAHYPPDPVLHRHGGGTHEKCGPEQQQQQQHPPTIEGIFGKDWCSDLWREERVATERKERIDSSAAREAVNLIDSDPDLIFVKEEAYDDQPIGQQMRARDHRKSMFLLLMKPRKTINVNNELRLHPRDLHNFPMNANSQAQQQGTQPPLPLIEHLIEDSGLSTFVDNTNPSQATGEYSDCMNNAHNNSSTNTSKQLAVDPRVRKPLKTFECLFCGKIFNYLSSLKVHIRRHSGEKPFSCPVCGKRFAQKTYLKLHQRVHSGEKPYSCQQCGKSFSQKSSLNIHLRTHTGEKPYSCVDCGKSYAYKYGFNHHQCFN